MQVYIDADGCPVINLTVEIARSYDLEITIVADYAHEFQAAEHVHVVFCDQGKDSVDFAILRLAHKKDIVITQDYGLATLLLAKGCYVISQNGMLYQDGNMEQLLNQRHMSAKIRKKDKHSGHMKKRTKEDDKAFAKAFSVLCEEVVHA